MPANTIKLTLDGTVSLGLFAAGVERFHGVVEGLTTDLSRDTDIEWLIDELDTGSAIAVVRGEAEKPEYVEQICREVVTLGRALQQHAALPYSEKVVAEARGLTAILNGRVTAITLETPDEDVTIYGGPQGEAPVATLQAYGAIEGRVETLSRRGGLRFTLFDTLHDRAISCYLQEGQQSLMRDAWGNRAIVEGWVSRDPETGRPRNIRRVSNVTILPDAPAGAYRRARGVVPIGPDDVLPEEAIRRVRDA